MPNHLIIALGVFIIYFHIGGLATTNILRLTSGNTLPVLSSTCACDSCGSKIPPLLQLPIISFIICKGKCKSCGVSIPVYPLLLEITIIVGMFLITFLFSFSFIGTILSFVFYEIVRVVVIVLRGRRCTDFAKQYIIAVLSMIPFGLCSVFVSFLYTIV